MKWYSSVSVASLVGAFGCAAAATAPQNGCGTKFSSWCVSKQVSSVLTSSQNRDEVKLDIALDDKSASLIFGRECESGILTGFRFVRREGRPFAGYEKPVLGWSPNVGSCFIKLERESLNDKEYLNLARSVHYYLIEMGKNKSLRTFPFKDL